MKRTRVWLLPAAVLVLLALLAGAGLYVKKVYTVETVYVEGNVHYTEDEIKELVMSGPLGDNSLYLSLKYKNKGIEDVPFIDACEVSILSPDTIRITVYEKALAGYIRYMDTYVYFDKDGYAVESSSVRTEGIPQVTGLTVDHVVLGEQLPVEDTEIFATVLDMTNLLDKYGLDADRLYFRENGELTLYFGDVRVDLGDESSYLEDKVMLLPEMLPSLEGESGTLDMSSYSEKGEYTFRTD